MKKIIIYFCFLFLFIESNAQSLLNFEATSDSTLYHILLNKDPLLDQVLKNPSKYYFQLIYTKVEKHADKINYHTYSINQGNQYYYPASLIKFPLAFVALEKLTALKDSGVHIDDSISVNTCSCDFATNNYVAKHKHPTMLQFLREMMVMSNNDAYNLYFDFVGRDLLNSRMHAMDIFDIQMKNRFTGGCGEENNKAFGGIVFNKNSYREDIKIPCSASIQNWEIDSIIYPTFFESKSYYKKKMITNRQNNAANNYVSLLQAHKLLINLMHPSAKLYQNDFKIDDAYKNEFIKALGSFPRELENSSYDTANLADYYYKFFIDPKVIQTNENKIRVYNKVGLASGFVSDVSYFYDSTHQIEYFISAAILSKKANSNENNYNDLGIPVLRKIGGLIYTDELYNKTTEKK
jgi:hypothetical protein